MSQNLDIGPSFDFMSKNGSHHKNVFYKYGKIYVWEMNIKGDIIVQKIKVKKYIFQFLAPPLYYLFAILKNNL